MRVVELFKHQNVNKNYELKKKNIMNIKRKIKEELNKRLLREAPGCTVAVSPIFDIECPDGSDGIAQSRRDTSCNWTTFTSCKDDGNPDLTTGGRGGDGRAPMGQTMGESRGYRRYKTRR